jgi:hypothetical protein
VGVGKDSVHRKVNVPVGVHRKALVAGHRRAVGRNRVVGVANSVLVEGSRPAVEEGSPGEDHRGEGRRSSHRLTF